MKILLKNITAVNPEQKLNVKTDILIDNGIIAKIGGITKDDEKNSRVFELSGKYLTPGLFDMHVHLREPGREDKETVVTGCNSAANGGYTGIASMPNTDPAADSAEVIQLIKERAAGHIVDVFPVAAATHGRKGESLSPMAELTEAGAVAFSDDGVAIKNASILKRCLEYSKMYNMPIIEHCEDESLAGGAMNESVTSTFLGLPPIPSIAEDLIVMRDIIMAEYCGGRVHIAHISTKNSVDMVRQAKAKNIPVTAEAAPHHFTMTEDALKTYDTNAKMNPPLRGRADLEAVLAGLKDGTIDCIASDHAPHTIEEKEVEFEYAPNGIVGLETEAALAISELLGKNVLTFEQLVEKMAVNPRKILNIPVPLIKEGEKANFTILDTEAIWTVDITKFKSKSKNSPFDKRLMKGKALGVINNGQFYFDGEYIKE
jgi:dihydroorotase